MVAKPNSKQKHKRECHKCQFNGKLSEVCLDCKGPSEKSYKGVNYVWLDELPDPDGMVDKRLNGGEDETTDGTGVTRPIVAKSRRSSASILSAMSVHSIPAVRAFAEILDQAIEEERAEANAGRSALPLSVEEALIPIIAKFMSLTPRELSIVWFKYHGKDDRCAAEALGITPQRVNTIIHQICRANPAIAATIQAMRRIGIGGARRGVRRDHTFQPELFGS